MTFDLEFVTADNPTASFEADVENAAAMLSAAIHNQITVNLIIGYGEVDGTPLTNGSAAAGPDNGEFISYSTVRADLIANAVPGDTTFNALPAGSSIQGQTWVAVWNAQLKLFGLLGANDTTTDDGAAGFATDISNSAMTAVALHELTHAMGRAPYGGSEPDIWDFYRFTSPGTYLFGDDQPPAPAAYFSLDGGNTKLADYGQNSDPSDFANSSRGEGTPISSLTPEDPFNQYYDSGTLQHLTTIDLEQLDALGFDTIAPAAGAPTLTITSTGALTNHTTQTIAGTIDVADAGLTVSIYDGTTLLGTVTPNIGGTWNKQVSCCPRKVRKRSPRRRPTRPAMSAPAIRSPTRSTPSPGAGDRQPRHSHQPDHANDLRHHRRRRCRRRGVDL